MNGCIYRTKDGECDLYAEGGKYTAFCEMENCEGRKQTNGDRIRVNSDEELARRIAAKTACMGCIFYEECNRRAWDRRCEDVWLDWLKSPADKDGDENV